MESNLLSEKQNFFLNSWATVVKLLLVSKLLTWHLTEVSALKWQMRWWFLLNSHHRMPCIIGQWVGQTGIPSFGIQRRGQSKLSFNMFSPRKSFLLHLVDSYRSSLTLSETETRFLPLPPFPHWTPLCSWWSCWSYKNLHCNNEFLLGLVSSFVDKVQDIADLIIRIVFSQAEVIFCIWQWLPLWRIFCLFSSDRLA